MDLSAESDAMDGGWLAPDCEDRLAAEVLAGDASGAVTVFGQARSPGSAVLRDSPATVATGSTWDRAAADADRAVGGFRSRWTTMAVR